ncbi:DUF4399 domain-containing protein [Haladaptatus sp. GCM10025707]|uniref:DUF4399 domain-containing protein n=1 Tax=unclassified Haladaptatus TaxID=2622732 RepID=UPI0023E8DF4D|nr:DUF4399 domain-containing protein [Haladaptatus sp. QDMS2]
MDNELSRRRFVTLTAAAGAVSVAGCTSGNDGGDTTTTDGQTTTGDGNGNGDHSVPDDASVAFESPTDGAALKSAAQVVMSAENFDIEPAGEVKQGAGHFHVLIDTDPVETGEVIPNDDQHRHFGDGSKQTVIDLASGDHTLTLQVGNGAHEALPLTDSIDVAVTDNATISIDSPDDGAEKESPVSVIMGAENFAIQEAGEVKQDTGHFHIIVDGEPVETGKPIPNDDTHLHYGNGSNEVEVELEPGEHRLTAQAGTGAHLALPLTDEISVTVPE